MTTRHTTTSDPDRADLEPVGIWMNRDGDGDRSTTVELLGDDGTLTTLTQHPDGSIEIRTEAMSSSGHAVRVPPRGAARPVRH